MKGSWEALLARLQASDFDGEAENLAAFVRVARAERESYPSLLAELKALRAAEPSSGDADVLAGKLLLDLGEHAAARVVLERAAAPIRLPSGRLEAWLGQVLLLSGEFEPALARLDRALELGPEYGWAWFHRAAARLALGNAEGAGADARAFAGRVPGAAASALSAMVAAGSGDWPLALGSLEEAARARPDQAWPWLLRSQLLRARGRLVDAQDALAQAQKRERSASLSAERAVLWEQIGDLPLALSDAAAAVEQCPCREHYLLKARLHASWREHAEAAQECTHALRAAPGDAEALFVRAQARSAEGKLELALADAQAIDESEGGDAALFFRAQLLVLNGLADEAERLLESVLGDSGRSDEAKAKARFYRGYALFRQGRAAQARVEWELCAAAGEGQPFSQKARFYATIAVGLSDREGAGSPSPRAAGLVLAGLGVDPPFSATAGALRTLRGCDVLFNNVTGDEMFELLRLFCPDVRALAYHQANEEERLAELILTEVRAGKRVGFVTRGHAIIYGGLGRELVRRCRAQDLVWRCLPTLSSADSLLARLAAPERIIDGCQWLDSEALLGSEGRSGDPAPLVLFMGEDMRTAQGGQYKGVDLQRFTRLCAVLEGRYGAGHGCFVLDHRVDQEPVACELGALSRMRENIGASTILYVPGGSVAALKEPV